MASEDLKAKTLEGFERMFNQGDLTYVDRLMHPPRSIIRSPWGPTSTSTSRRSSR